MAVLSISKIPFDKLTSQLQNVADQVFDDKTISQLRETTKNFEALTTPLVGKLAGEANNGLKAANALLRELPIPEAHAKLQINLKNATSVPQNLAHVIPDLQKPMSQLQENIQAGLPKLKPAIDGAAASIASSITGSGVQTGFNHAVTNIANAKGLNAALDRAASDMGQVITSGELQTNVRAAVGQFNGALEKMLPQIKDFKVPDILDAGLIGNPLSKMNLINADIENKFSDALKTLTDLPVMDVLHDVNKSFEIVQGTLQLPKVISDGIVKDVLKKINVGDINQVVTQLRTDPRIGTFINQTFTQAALGERIQEMADKFGTVGKLLAGPGSAIGSLARSTNPVLTTGALTKGFTYVNSFDEVAAELVSATRKIDSVIVHWSETYNDQNVKAQDIEKSAGSVEYHYVILRDGSIQRGKSINSAARHADKYDASSISVLIIAGYDAVTGDVAALSETSVTPSQVASLKGLVSVVYDIIPGAEVWGHGEVDQTVDPKEPGVPIGSFIHKTYGKANTKPPEVTVGPSNYERGLPTGKGDVAYTYKVGVAGAGKERYEAIQPALMAILEQVSADFGIKIRIYSGGNGMTKAECLARGGYVVGKRWFTPDGIVRGTGSVRHNNGWGADIYAYLGDRQLDFGGAPYNSLEREIAQAFAAAGITGMGAKTDYMGPGMHVDIAYGREPGTNAARYWLPNAYVAQVMGNRANA